MHRAAWAMENERMKTHLLIEIDHSKALPDDVTDDVANRVYTMLHARGIACDVTVATNPRGVLPYDVWIALCKIATGPLKGEWPQDRAECAELAQQALIGAGYEK